MHKLTMLALVILFILLLLSACGALNNETPVDIVLPAGNTKSDSLNELDKPDIPERTEYIAPEDTDQGKANDTNDAQQDAGDYGHSVQVVAEPDSITVLVNKQFSLPENYRPDELVYPDVPFTFEEKIDKRKMRKEAAEALERMFAGAEKDNIYLAGVSGYRSSATQRALFDRYVRRDGEAKARTFSAVPGQSEHQTGLAMDVTGIDGKCAAMDCFGGSKEAIWLAEHASEYGFIIRYPEGKQSITGYKYEPWHLRYVGTIIAIEIAAKNMTLEEYYNHAVPVSQ
jgi:D-alanyl-D-alanine carboxypeptidase